MTQATPHNQYEENPFTTPHGAKDWMLAVESESNGVRDREIYPRLRDWSANLAPQTSVLEIGSGQGICSQHINQKYRGVEPSEPLVERATALYGEWFSVGTIYELEPVIPDSFTVGAVFSVNVWWHLANLERASQQYLRVLPTNGQFLIITGNPDAWLDWESMFTITERTEAYFAGHAKTLTTPLSRDIFYTHSLRDITDALTAAGAADINVESFGNIEDFTKPAFVAITGRRAT